MMPTAGVRLGGRYELRSRLAVGGVGEVWLGRDLSLRRAVAVKVLRPELAGDERFLSYLRSEARTSASLTHPNIAALYDYGEDDGTGYLVLELVRGEPLTALLARDRRLRPDVLLPVLTQAASALHAAHEAGVVHRDVKPSNILLMRSGRVKITDFGISVTAGSSAQPPRGVVLGTAPYLAPEQVLGRAASPSSDIYALGVVAFEAAVGCRPFLGPDLLAVAHAHVIEAVPRIPDDVPSGLAALLREMLEKDPRRRPASAAVVAHRLDDIRAELGVADPGPLPADLASFGAGAGPDPPDSSVETAALVVEQAEEAPQAAQPSPRATRGWPWLVVATADVIAVALRAAAYRLARTVTSGAGREVGVPRVGPPTAAPTLTGDGGRAAGNVSRRQTEVEDGSW